MSELVKYEQARSALAHCVRVDEAKAIRDKAEALRAYGRQANDHELETWAAALKVRASRRIGQISQTLESGAGRPSKILPPSGRISKASALSSAGISVQAANRCERIAEIPEKEFEAVLAEKLAGKVPVSSKELLSRFKRDAKVSKRKTHPVSDDLCTTKDLGLLVERGMKFGTVYGDPPWQYGNQSTRASTDNHYDTMTVEELCELPIRDLAAEESHLWLWTTNGFLFECPKLFDAQIIE